MKTMLLAFAVILACAAYDLDGGAAAWPGSDLEQRLDAQLRDGAWRPAAEGDEGGIEARMPDGAAGTIEREQSIRLFGPGVSRKQQIRV